MSTFINHITAPHYSNGGSFLRLKVNISEGLIFMPFPVVSKEAKEWRKRERERKNGQYVMS